MGQTMLIHEYANPIYTHGNRSQRPFLHLGHGSEKPIFLYPFIIKKDAIIKRAYQLHHPRMLVAKKLDNIFLP